MERNAEGTAANLREYLVILRNRKTSIALVTLLVFASALAYSLRQPPLYRSEAKVLVKPFNTILNLETERELATSEAVRDVAAEKLDEELEGEPLSPANLSVSVATETEVLIIGYTHSDPGEAQRAAQAYAEGYVDYRRQEIVDDITASGESIRQQMEPLQERLLRLNKRIQKEDDPAIVSTLSTQANSLISRIAILEQSLAQLSPPGRLQVGQVVEDADLPLSPSSPNHVANGILGLMLGLALGIGVAFLRERLDDRLRGRTDLEKYAAAPVLAIVPSVPEWRKAKQIMLVTLRQPHSAASEAYRTLRTGVLFAAGQQHLKVILVTSANAGEGKSATTANLGVALAQSGKRVIMISGDLRKPRLIQFFSGDRRGPGVTNVLAGEANLWTSLVNTMLPTLKVLPSGPIPPNPTELLGSQGMRKILEDCAEAADVVLVDGPPILALADAITLAPLADGVLLVADAQETDRGAVEHARQQIDRVHARVIGAVLNNFDPSKAGAQAYYYQDYYAYRATEQATFHEGAEPERNVVRGRWRRNS
ncbi:MAG: polysaccharide biosynthesis tyrosine autokinase [Actinomycetota bacterium]|nr:polysaccharide biosynthesis tyrosine autokinase [Actinomycetota bacterium]